MVALPLLKTCRLSVAASRRGCGIAVRRRCNSSKLYIGNLPYNTTDEDLKRAFSEAGSVVEAAVIMERHTGRSRGFGFVTMATQEKAEKAIEMFNGKDFDGRVLVVNEARPLQPRAPRDGGMGGEEF